MVAVGTMVWLSSELMFFAALFAFYFTIRGHESQLWAERTVMLNVPFALCNTIVLVVSSVWCQLGVLQAEKGIAARPAGTPLRKVSAWGMREWYVLTYAFGAIFVAGQIFEYANLIREGVTLSSDAYGSVFYLTTGFHGFPVIGGLFAFVVVLLRSTVGKFTPEKATSAIVVSYYWHFVDVVWIALYAAIYIIQ
jgi:cytochrome c oxidase subunit 3